MMGAILNWNPCKGSSVCSCDNVQQDIFKELEGLEMVISCLKRITAYTIVHLTHIKVPIRSCKCRHFLNAHPPTNRK